MLEQFTTYFEQIKRAIFSFNSIGDFFDVILVAFVIYSAIKLIKDTRAFQLVKGVILLSAVYFVVSLLDMEASKYLLGLLFGNLLIILVIIFFPRYITNSSVQSI